MCINIIYNEKIKIKIKERFGKEEISCDEK